MCGSGGGWVGGTSDYVGIALQNRAEIMLQNRAGNCAAEPGREIVYESRFSYSCMASAGFLYTNHSCILMKSAELPISPDSAPLFR